MVPRDKLWKSILEDLFEFCVRFFYPIEAETVDWSHPPEFLDKELSKLFPKSTTPGRVADKLAKIWLLDGTERWMLIHIEVQGQPDMDFPLRMYQYRVRIKERYGADIVGLAILTDDSKSFRPQEYREQVWDNELVYRFHSFKLHDHPPEYFANPNNPFSIIMETAFYGLKAHKLDDAGLLEVKKKLIQNLLRKDFDRQRVLNVLHFIDEYVHFGKPEFQVIFDSQIDVALKIGRSMSTYELVLRARRAENRKLEKKLRTELREVMRGEVRGEVRGELLEEVRGEAQQEGLEMAIERLLRKQISAELVSEMLEVSIEEVRAIQARLKAADSN